MLNPTKQAIIIAGPHGSGKSTFINGLEYLFRDIKNRVNPDDIKGCTPFLSSGKSFLLETIFSTQDRMDFVKGCKKSGYSVIIFYLATNDPAINNGYIFDRVIKGGHTVPMNRILSEYYRSIENIKKIAAEVDRVFFIDNSIMFESPILYTALSYGSCCFDTSVNKPQWIEKVLENVKDLEFVADENKFQECKHLQNEIENNFLNAVENNLYTPCVPS